MMSEYDQLAKIYDPWSAADPAALQTLRFYCDFCSQVEGRIVELGIGNGRIALEFAKRGKPVIGIDISEAMLAECQARASTQGLSHLVQLMQSDIRTFSLPEPADLIILAFRTFGHLLTGEDKLAALRRVYQQLAPGGWFVFDHYVINLTWARNNHGIPRLMCKTFDEQTGTYEYVWDTYLYNFEEQRMECTITIEKTDAEGTVLRRQHAPLTFSWVHPDQVRNMLSQAGFQIEALYGSFRREPFNDTSKEQIWVARRPEHTS